MEVNPAVKVSHRSEKSTEIGCNTTKRQTRDKAKRQKKRGETIDLQRELEAIRMEVILASANKTTTADP